MLIVCEGEKNEPSYLKSLIHDFGLTTADVVVCGECDSAPTSVVDFGESKLKEDSEFEIIFFVFDRDSHATYDAALAQIKGLQKRKSYRRKTIKAITSVPCFEIWFLLHFELHTTPYVAGGGKSPCANLISVLKKKYGFTDYQKGDGSHYTALKDRLQCARANAKKALAQALATGGTPHYGNPTTQMHILIDELEAVAGEAKK